MMKSKSKPVCGEVMRAALRRVVGTDTPAVAVFACETPRLNAKLSACTKKSCASGKMN